MQLKPGTILQDGKYEITRVLGQGGFGITYLAEHSMMNRQVCIKEFFVKEYCDRNDATSRVSLGSKGNEELMRRYMAKFIKEAQTVARLSHAHIVNIYDSFYENNTTYAVMEYIDGCTLAEWVRDHGPISEELAVDYMHQIGAALSYAHARRVTHLDVKPSNVMLAEGGKKAILIDFGMAKHYGESGEQTSSTPVGVSHGYAPLEQYQSGGVKGFSPATDIYALAATLYFALTGERPAQAAELMLHDGLQRVDGDFSLSVKEAILAAMRSHKEERPQSVEDFLELLDARDDSDVIILSVEDDPEPEIGSHPNSGPKISNFAGPVGTQKKKVRLPLVTIIYLALGLLVGAFLIKVSIEGCVEAWSPSSPVFGSLSGLCLVLSTVGAIMAEAGIVLMLCKWRCGFWLFFSGGLILMLWAALAFNDGAERIMLLIWGALMSLPVYGITSLILMIKGKQGVSGWKQLRKGFPRRIK